MSEEIKNIIDEIVGKLYSEFAPDSIYLFGSYAWGIPNPDSDLDIFVVLDDSKDSKTDRSRRAYKSLRYIDISLPIDILVRTKDELHGALENKNSIYYKIINQGHKLYAKSKST